ncbi:unnamed protein product [Scytosiphon promiscuus]
MAAVEEAQDDQLAVTVLEDVRVPNLAAVELPLAVKPTDSGKDAALALVGGIEELSKVTADEVGTAAAFEDAFGYCCCCGTCFGLRSHVGFAATEVRVEESTFVFQALATTEIRLFRDVVGEIHSRNPASADLSERALKLHMRPKDPLCRPLVARRNESNTASFVFKILRREKKYHDTVKLQKGGLLVYHRFGEGVKHRTKDGDTLIKEAKAVKHLEVKLNERWGTGRLRGRHNRPSRFRKGVREQQLLLATKITAVFEKRPMYFMKELKDILQEQPKWVLRDVVPAVAYYYCNGPWRSRWVRFGYRPEDYPEAR